MADEVLTRFGNAPESADRLARDAAHAEAVLGIHGVSVTARPPKRPAPSARPMPTISCCRDLAKHVPCCSPFNVLALSLYDGPTAGAVQCKVCATAYRFDMLDWNDDHDVRVFRLAELSSGVLEDLVRLFSASEEPSWPVWVPFARSRPARAAHEVIHKAAAELLKITTRSEFVLAWQGYGETILAIRNADANLPEQPDWFARESLDGNEDWFAFLELPKVVSRV